MNSSAKNIVITGATDGLGLRLAFCYANENANLILTGRRTHSEIKHLLPPNSIYVQADQSTTSCADKICERIARTGWDKIDHLILNAGIGTVVDPLKEPNSSITNTMQVNLIAPISITHKLAPFLTRSGLKSSVVFIGSTARKGTENFASYCASKAAITGFVRALASELRPNIRIQIIHPGPTKTRMQEKAGLKADFSRHFFVDADYCAREIKYLIEARKPESDIRFLPYLGYRLAVKLGLKPRLWPIVSP